MADEMKPTPRGFISGLFSDVLGRTLNMPSMPRTGIPTLDLFYANRNSLFNAAGVGDVQKTAERISYGQPLTTGQGMTLRPREEAINAAMNVAPFAPAVGRLASRAVKATEGMPVGMGIKDVSPKIGINVNQGGSSFADKIISGEKKFETRESDSLRSYVGKRVGIIRTGEGKAKAIGDVTLGEPIVVSSPEEFAKLRDLHLVPEGSKFDIKEGGVKYLYPIENPVPYGVEKDVAKYGIVSRKILGEPDTLEKALYPQQAALPVKPPTDDVYEVMDATFNYGKLGGNKTIPIDQLTGGVRMSDPTEARRVKELADKISSPEGYISRIIVDDSGNVLEGQHRLEALRLLGEKNVPVAVIEDLSNKYNISAMENAIQGKFRSDQSNQLIRQAIDTLEEAGSVEKALSDYSMPAIFQQPFQDAIRASQKVTPTPIESPTFTDPFGNTIGSSIR